MFDIYSTKSMFSCVIVSIAREPLLSELCSSICLVRTWWLYHV